MTEIERQRFKHYRQRLFATIEAMLKIDSHHKSYEGRLVVAEEYPNYFESEGDAPVHYVIHLSCYVLGTNRGYDYEGKTLLECIAKAESDLTKWETELKEEAK